MDEVFGCRLAIPLKELGRNAFGQVVKAGKDNQTTDYWTWRSWSGAPRVHVQPVSLHSL